MEKTFYIVAIQGPFGPEAVSSKAFETYADAETDKRLHHPEKWMKIFPFRVEPTKRAQFVDGRLMRASLVSPLRGCGQSLKMVQSVPIIEPFVTECSI